MKSKLSATGSLKLLNNSTSSVGFVCIYIHISRCTHLYIHKLENDARSMQRVSHWQRPVPIEGQEQICLGDLGGLLGEQRETRLSFAYAGTFALHIHIWTSLHLYFSFLPIINCFLPSNLTPMNAFLEETSQALSAAKVIKISVTSAHNTPCMLNISFIINIRCQLNTVTVTLKYPTLNSECLTSRVRSGP